MMKTKLFVKGNLSEFFLNIFMIIAAAIGGYLISNKYWFFGIASFILSFITSIKLSKMKQNVNLSGTSAIPPPASNYSKGTLYIQYKK